MPIKSIFFAFFEGRKGMKKVGASADKKGCWFWAIRIKYSIITFDKKNAVFVILRFAIRDIFVDEI
ncbi:hypothetical protein FFWV33_02025 [Flavobacterium faecale]|uniref:Uncharacterized protein n=1 Tax=Flavobacterium faecale TaxID=1355330 RepID=A0A2S1L9F5_9FLAO|nr:hypothetical protein FFWV33_02025 [Flavobacterium faecale]